MSKGSPSSKVFILSGWKPSFLFERRERTFVRSDGKEMSHIQTFRSGSPLDSNLLADTGGSTATAGPISKSSPPLPVLDTFCSLKFTFHLQSRINCSQCHVILVFEWSWNPSLFIWVNQISAHFFFGNTVATPFAAQHLAPSSAFHKDFLASFCRQKLMLLINTGQPWLQNSNLRFNWWYIQRKSC
jgi:hypothetical protein